MTRADAAAVPISASSPNGLATHRWLPACLAATYALAGTFVIGCDVPDIQASPVSTDGHPIAQSALASPPQNNASFLADCSAGLNSQQISVQRTVVSSFQRLIGVLGPAHATGNPSFACGDMTFVKAAGPYDSITFTPLYHGPNVTSSAHDCEQTAVAYAVYNKDSAGTYHLHTNGMLFGKLLNGVCTHDASFASFGPSSVTIDGLTRDPVFSFTSLTEQNGTFSQPGPLCSTHNCWFPTAAFAFGRQHRFNDQDYDGDGRDDQVFVRASNGVNTWAVKLSSGAPDLVAQFGLPSAIPVPADYDGDGKTDLAVYNPSSANWQILPSSGGPVFGDNVGGSIPVPGDYNGDGRADIAVFRPSDGMWASKALGFEVQFGRSTDVPVPGDYDGDSKTDVAVFRPSSGTWFARLSGGGPDMVIQFGNLTQFRLVPADYDGDGKIDPAVFRNSDGTWFAHLSGGGPDMVRQFGTSEFRTVRGDYDGDGRTDVAVFRPSDGRWFARPSAGGSDLVIQWGVASDRIPYQN